MKRYYKSLLSLFMSAIIVLSVMTPMINVTATDKPEISVVNLIADGDVSDTGYLSEKWVDENGKEVTFDYTATKKPVANHSVSIPSKYSSKDLGYCSDVRYQGGTNSCWAFASVAAAETTLLRKGLVSKNSELSDLSEAHLVWFAHKSLTTDVNDPTFGDGTNVGSPYSSGGDWHRSTFTLARGAGYALEKDYPFYADNVTKMGNYPEENRYDSKVTLDSAYLIPDDNTEEIKKAIMTYGAVNFAGAIAMGNLNGSAYYQNSTTGTNHQMIAVGWDDDFSVNNFKADCRPQSDGAWLVKNSYDTTWGDNGYFWISYEDPSLTSFLVQDVSLTNEDETIYQYDGYGYASGLVVAGIFDALQANVFTAEKDEAISSVAFHTMQDNVTYEISVYKNVTYGKGSPVADGEMFPVVTYGKAQYKGYHKIPLEQAVPVSKGETFSIVIRMTVPENGGVPIYIPVEGKNQVSDSIYTRYNSSENGQSFFTFPGYAWSETVVQDQNGNEINYNNVCIKAFTVPDNTFQISTAEEFNDFALRVANGESFEGKNINLACDIDFNGGEIIPVGTDTNPFAGYFLGNGYVLKNGVINSESDYAGVFSAISENAQISKLGIEDISVTGAYGVGALCGYNEGKIIHCYATGNVQGEESVGGLVGINAGEISYSYSTCNVSGDYYVGSFIGESQSGTDTNCYVITSDWDLIGNDYGEVIPADEKYFSDGLVAFLLDEGTSSHRKNVWTKRDGKTTFLKSSDETVYRVELFDKSTYESIYLYVNANDNLKTLAEQKKEGMTVTFYADPQHRVLYESVPNSNMMLYVEWKASHICEDNLEFIHGTDADCYTGGNQPYYRCSCGNLYKDEKATELTDENWIIINPFNHPIEDIVKTERVEPTHTTDGNIEYYTCLICKDIFEDSDCTIKADETVLTATGHSYSDWIVVSKVSCTTDGYRYRICSCDDKIEEFTPSTGHSYSETVTPPTDTEQGYITMTCDNCGDSYISQYIPVQTDISVSGKVTSYLSDTDEITVELIRFGETESSYTLYLTGNNTVYNIESILSGVYTIRISKKNHATREYENVVIKEGEFDFKICPIGDANNDGKVSLLDYTAVLRHTKKISLLEGYSYKCADVDSNGKINISDYANILKHVKKVINLWK